MLTYCGAALGTDRSVVFLSLELSHDGFQGLRGPGSQPRGLPGFAENGMTKSAVTGVAKRCGHPCRNRWDDRRPEH